MRGRKHTASRMIVNDCDDCETTKKPHYLLDSGDIIGLCISNSADGCYHVAFAISIYELTN